MTYARCLLLASLTFFLLVSACSDDRSDNNDGGGAGEDVLDMGDDVLDTGLDAAPTCATMNLSAGVQCTDALAGGGASYRVPLAPGEYVAVQAEAAGGLRLSARYGGPAAEEMAATAGPAARLALHNPGSTPVDAWLAVAPETAAADTLALRLEGEAFSPEVPCTAGCAAVLQIPAPVPKGPYLLASPPRYLFGRRELAQALVAAAGQVPPAEPVGIGDLSQADGKIPGTDRGQPRHPAPSHRDGFSADVAYYRKGGDNLGTRPACPTPDRRFCSGPHDLDLERTVAFMLALCREPRISQILVDPLMQPDLLKQAAQLRRAGRADPAALARLKQVLMSGIPYHTDHFHIAVYRQCNDGLDNDGDGKIDLADPGCEGALDDSE